MNLPLKIRATKHDSLEGHKTERGEEKKNCNPLLQKEQEQSQRSSCPEQPARLRP